jgi:hypothetical protein
MVSLALTGDCGGALTYEKTTWRKMSMKRSGSCSYCQIFLRLHFVLISLALLSWLVSCGENGFSDDADDSLYFDQENWSSSGIPAREKNYRNKIKPDGTINKWPGEDAQPTAATEGLDEIQDPHLKILLKANEKAPGWPANPRRTLSISENFSNATSFKVGVRGDFFGAEAGVETSVTFTLNFTSNLVLMRTCEGEKASFFKESAGKRQFDVKQGVGFVGLCSYAASARAGAMFSSNLSLFGTGLSNVSEIARLLEVNQGSQFFHIRAEDTVRGLQDLCLDQFKRQVKNSVIADLKELIKANLVYHDRPPTAEQQALMAAIYGPDARGVSLYDEQWTVKKADIRYEDRVIKISGEIVRHIPAAPGDKAYYALEYKDGVRIKRDFWAETNNNLWRGLMKGLNGKTGDQWKAQAEKLADFLGAEIFTEVRDSEDIQNLRPQGS